MKTIEQYNKEIEKVTQEYQEYDAKAKAELETIRARLEKLGAEMETRRKKKEDTVIKLQSERDAAALALKLAQFPKKLVEGHKFCSVCKSAMRPFEITKPDGTTEKLWGCQNGSLRIDHDLVKVE